MLYLRSFTAALLIAGASLPAAASPFSQMIVFGDSLSDTGNAHIGAQVFGLPDPTPASEGYFDGRFSDGLMYTDYMHARLVGGLSNPIAPVLFNLNRPSGPNYAVGGARAATNADQSLDLDAQLQTYQNQLTIQNQTVDPNALYVINFGSNDARAQIQGQQDAPSDAAVANTLAGAVINLFQQGANHVLFMNVGDLGAEPVFNGQEAVARARVQALNGAIDTTLNAALNNAFGVGPVNANGTYELAGGRFITYFDTFGWGDDVIANPTSFGLPGNIDFETPCFDVQDPPVNCAAFAWADSIHPSQAIHQVLANSVLPYVLDQSAFASVTREGLASGGRLTSPVAAALRDGLQGCALPAGFSTVGTPAGNQIAGGTITNVRRAPGGVNADCYLSVGFGELTIDLGGVIEYFGAYIGSLDEYNFIEFFEDSGTPGVPGAAVSFGDLGTRLSGEDLATLFSVALYGDDYYNFRFNAFNDVRYVRFSSTNTAIEIGELAWMYSDIMGPGGAGISVNQAAVPAPAGGWLLVLGAALAAGRARRRR